jgi:hypothetical protein
LADGPHRLTLYAADMVGNSAEKTVFFNIAPFPVVAAVAVLTIVIIALAGGYLFLKRRKPSGTKQTGAAKSPPEKPGDSGFSSP